MQLTEWKLVEWWLRKQNKCSRGRQRNSRVNNHTEFFVSLKSFRTPSTHWTPELKLFSKLFSSKWQHFNGSHWKQDGAFLILHPVFRFRRWNVDVPVSRIISTRSGFGIHWSLCWNSQSCMDYCLISMYEDGRGGAIYVSRSVHLMVLYTVVPREKMKFSRFFSWHHHKYLFELYSHRPIIHVFKILSKKIIKRY